MVAFELTAHSAAAAVQVEFVGKVGRMKVEVEGKQSANPRTGAMVPFSVLKAIKNHTQHLVVGL